ncbi:4-alpha-glucanotransferase [Brachybacterium hainanense]|uniref:4-alpha-glucanotransferase n=1 Tax=Brachybacterium hainanense TaxID=1541174 RepID=A0ABV6RGF2_9MICO
MEPDLPAQRSAPSSSDLREFARDLGIGTDHWGFDGTLKQVPDATLLKVMRALGHEISTGEDIARARAEREAAQWRRTLPPVTVLREDEQGSVPVHVAHGSPVRLSLRLEEGTAQDLPQIEDNTPPLEVDGMLRGRARFAVPSGLPLGWHVLVAHVDGGTVEADLVVTPVRLDAQDDLGARQAVGVQAQLYSIRSQGSWGIGDLGDLRDLSAILGARHGADFLLVNPLHASDPQPPMEPSPYLPVTRRFTSALYLRIEDVPEYASLPEFARQRIGLLRTGVASWNERADRLERDEVLGAKMQALKELFAAPRTAGRQALFDAFRAREGQGLADFALWSALVERARRTHAAFPEPGSDVVQQARLDLADRIELHEWIQFVLDEQLGRAQSAALDAGMRVGIMHDLAVGVTTEGADAWRLGPVLARGVGVGAPADQYNQHGQNWHQPPWRPDALAAESYRPWRDMLRSLMRHAGALRIDHVLGLFRLWWIPEGNLASDGAYVHYDHDAMIGILALEARRSGTIVIGEDLGTFEPWVRGYLDSRGILGTSILWFETQGDGGPIPPSQYRSQCLASVNTHDLPPTAGYLAGDHVRLRHELGLLDGSLEEELEADAAARARFLDAIAAQGLLREGERDDEELVLALHRYLASSPSLLLGVSLVDCVGERRIQNQPGTDEEYPNWRIPLADAAGRVVTVEDVATDARTARLLAAVRQAAGT